MPYRRSALMQDRLADNRARIMRATRHLIARGGFRAAQIAAVAGAAGLSTGSIYRYFPSQAQLFIEVLTAAVAHEIELLERIATAPGAAAARLKEAVETFARRALEGRNLAYAFIAEPIGTQVELARMRSRREFCASCGFGSANNFMPAAKRPGTSLCTCAATSPCRPCVLTTRARVIKSALESLANSVRETSGAKALLRANR